jgi:1,4-alpha-glucan branching enzyme
MANPGNIKSGQSLSSKTPFADLMLHPEKLDAVLKPAPGSTVPSTHKRKNAAKAAGKSSSHPAPPPRSSLKKAKFSLKVAGAGSVKLAGDFTNWEQSPIEMTSSENGDWSAVISLEPGHYAYRFIVDGKWQDDPRCAWRVTNPFGTENAVIEII